MTYFDSLDSPIISNNTDYNADAMLESVIEKLDQLRQAV